MVILLETVRMRELRDHREEITETKEIREIKVELNATTARNSATSPEIVEMENKGESSVTNVEDKATLQETALHKTELINSRYE